MKEKLKNVFLILILVGMFMYYLISAIWELTNKKDLHTVNLAGAFEILEVEHAINGLIPIGKEYYYIGLEETYDAYIIKASNKWLENNFDSGYMAKDEGGFRITALSGKVRDFKISRELQSRAANIEGLNYPLGTEYCLYTGYKSDALIKLIIVVLCIILTITFIFFVKPESEEKPILKKCWIVGLTITLVLMLMILY